MSKEIDNIKQNLLRELKVQTDAKITNTPFGQVSSELKHLTHSLPMKKGEILATVVHKKTNTRKEEFVWMGLVERYEYNAVWKNYIIFYRPFIDQYEKNVERREQLYRKQWRDLK